MAEEISYFRKRFLGGFNREDVIRYITKLTKERNGLRDAKEAADEEARAIADEIEPLRKEIAEVRGETELAIGERDRVILEMTDEVAALKFELEGAKRAGDENREAKERAQQESRNKDDEIAALGGELEAARQEAAEGRRHKAEAQASKAALETVEKTIADIGSAYENLRNVFYSNKE